jgi:hypothetical protein
MDEKREERRMNWRLQEMGDGSGGFWGGGAKGRLGVGKEDGDGDGRGSGSGGGSGGWLVMVM